MGESSNIINTNDEEVSERVLDEEIAEFNVVSKSVQNSENELVMSP